MDKHLADGKTVQLEMYDEEQFFVDAVSEFPTLASEIHEEWGMVYTCVDILGNEIRRAITQGELAHAARVFEFLGRAISDPRAKGHVEDAIATWGLRIEEIRAQPDPERLLKLIPSCVKTVMERGAA
jgi:hypothetical protein